MEENDRTDFWRRVAARTLVVLGVVLLVVTILASYLRWQALDPETFRGTAEELIADPAVRDEVAATLVDELFTNVDVQAELEERLPPDQQRLAGVAAAGLRAVADRVALQMLERPRVQRLWLESVSASHAELVALLKDETRTVTIESRGLVLDLKPLLARLGERLAIFGTVSDRLPEDAGLIVIMEADSLERAQDLTALFETVATWIWILPFLLWALAIWLARGRRRLEVRAIAIGIVVAGVLVLLVRALAGRYVVDELATTPTLEEAAGNAWAIVTDLLADGAWSAVAVGLVALLGVWLAGGTRSGTAARRWLAPILARGQLTYGLLAALFLLFVWWGPFAQSRRPLYLLVVALLLVAGVEIFRRLVAREFPDAIETQPRELLRPLSRLRPRRPAGTSASTGDVERLEELARLKRDGLLDEDEFRAAKARLLRAADPAP